MCLERPIQVYTTSDYKFTGWVVCRRTEDSKQVDGPPMYQALYGDELYSINRWYTAIKSLGLRTSRPDYFGFHGFLMKEDAISYALVVAKARMVVLPCHFKNMVELGISFGICDNAPDVRDIVGFRALNRMILSEEVIEVEGKRI